ncbi:hypothetical protein NQ314_016728 [Rhamnusium bicolor]|uniref:Septin n=1 Tax=Rhamnusium bicolor TaxID=1586634 RepID=A0AAV8WVK0_9CUCU|nr:hypothetical protein NQ314_016728 [Rhamnusium bicolor]
MAASTKETSNNTSLKKSLLNNTSSFSFCTGKRRDGKDSESTYRMSSLDRVSLRQKYLDLSMSQNNARSNKETNNSFIKDFSTLIQSPYANNVPELRSASKEIIKKPSITSEENQKPQVLDGYVGFANLPNQVYRKAVKTGFDFTLMVVGQSGLANTLDQRKDLKKTVSVETTKVILSESGVNLALTVIDTPGFGDAVNNTNCWLAIREFIESKYEAYLNSETKVNRNITSDERVHCCLYFIQASGHGLKPLDVEFMKQLCDKVNIIPIIAKADTLTEEECVLFKEKVMQEIAEHMIKIYEFPDISEEDDEFQLNKSLKERVPFAVVGSNAVIEVNGKQVRGRRYPWGVVDIEDLTQNDFTALRKMVICTHLQDLKDVTHFVHYENYRFRKLSGLRTDGRYLNKNILIEIDKEKQKHDLKIRKLEAEVQQIFELKFYEKVQKLKDSEAAMTKKI